jgi:L-malate glycosyltransferase
MKKKILFLVPYPFDKAPSQRLKFEQYYKYFEENGYIIDKSSFISNAFWEIIYKKGFFVHKLLYTLSGYLKRLWDLFRLRQYAIVYVHLWVTPFGLPFFEWLVCKLSKRVIYDIDDLIYLPESKSNANSFVGALKGNDKPIFLMKNADHVITCTPYLDQFVRRFNMNTTDISSTVDTCKYKPKSDYSINNRKVILGWSGSHSTSKYLNLLEPVFLKLTEMGISFKLLVVGDTNFKIDGIETETLPWKESHEVEVIKQFDIGLYPLPDEQWVYGKSGLKALQYMAAGVPTIATGIGANYRIIENGVNGFLVNTNEEWKVCLINLIADEALRKRIGVKGTEIVEARFSITSNKAIYLSILSKVLAK